MTEPVSGQLPYDPLVAWRADLDRYPARPFLREQSIWAVAVYRFGQWNDTRRPGPVRFLADRLYWALFRAVEVITGVSFSKATQIGPGLRIHHFGNVFVNERSRIGALCTLRQGVTIGSLTDDGPAPVLGDGVEVGAYGQILGDVHIGDGARVGAMSVVLDDVQPGTTVVGAPARVVSGGSVPFASHEPAPRRTGREPRDRARRNASPTV